MPRRGRRRPLLHQPLRVDEHVIDRRRRSSRRSARAPARSRARRRSAPRPSARPARTAAGRRPARPSPPSACGARDDRGSPASDPRNGAEANGCAIRTSRADASAPRLERQAPVAAAPWSARCRAPQPSGTRAASAAIARCERPLRVRAQPRRELGQPATDQLPLDRPRDRPARADRRGERLAAADARDERAAARRVEQRRVEVRVARPQQPVAEQLGRRDRPEAAELVAGLDRDPLAQAEVAHDLLLPRGLARPGAREAVRDRDRQRQPVAARQRGGHGEHRRGARPAGEADQARRPPQRGQDRLLERVARGGAGSGAGERARP